MTIVLQSVVGRELLPSEADENIRDLADRTQAGWKDMVGTILLLPTSNPIVKKPFGPSGLSEKPTFGVGAFAPVSSFHVNHDIKVGGKAHIHIHWSTAGVDTNSVKWEFQIIRALGHDQAFFGAAESYFVEQTPNQVSPGAWRHYIAEVSDGDAITLTEPDEIIDVVVRRVTNGAVDNTDDIFGVTVDFHYESDRDSTISKVPDFYTA